MRWGLLTKSRSFYWWTPYGATEEEAIKNRLALKANSPPPTPWTMEDLDAWNKLVRSAGMVPGRRRVKPEGAPLTKTEEKRKAAKEKRRASMQAYYAKHPRPDYSQPPRQD
jgi:hypothetical protein